jgi:pimeloyl-ACP methyl ester carboxylesterase
MPVLTVNGINIGYAECGSGEAVVLVTGSGAKSQVWQLHQVPALIAAGYRVVMPENRGVPPTDVGPPGFTVADMAADVAGLIEALGIAPCRIVGFSLGGMVVQELLVTRGALISQAVLMATRGRTDVLRAAMSKAELGLLDGDITLPPRYAAMVQATQHLSPTTLNDERRIADWLDLFELSPSYSAIKKAQQGLDEIGNRLADYHIITTPCLVIGFQDDLMSPPHLCREVADSIPGGKYEEVAGCGHYGYLEEPDAVNSLIVGFFSSFRPLI